MTARLSGPTTAGCVMGMGIAIALSAQAATSEKASRGIDTVQVTAQRRVESIQEVPLAVSVVDGESLREGELHSLSDLSAVVPAFVTTRSVNYGTAPLSIRGVGGANGGGNIFSDEPVALYVNDAFINKVWFTTADLVDVSSIQVLRGPQGSLYGRNATAGAVLVTTAAPTSELIGYVLSSLTDQDETRVQGAISGPLGAGLQGRIAAGYVNDEGWARNSFNGQKLGTSRDRTLRGSLRWGAENSAHADLIVEYLSSKSRPVTFALADLSQLASPAPPNVVMPYQLRPDFRDRLEGDTFAYDTPTETQVDSRSATLSVRVPLGALTFESISAGHRSHLSGRQDSDGSALAILENGGSETDSDCSQELRLSNASTERLAWVTGAYFYRQRNDVHRFIIRNQFGFLGAGTEALFRPAQTLSSWAAFADATLHVTERFDVTVGGRYSTERKEFQNFSTATTLRAVTAPPGVLAPVAVPVPAGATIVAPVTVDFEDSWRNFSPRGVLTARITPTVLSYLSYSKGFKSGGFNAFGTSPAFAPEKLAAVEVGVKSSAHEGRVLIDTSLFEYDYSNLQVRVPVPTGGVDIQNAAAARIRGAELQAAVQPLDALVLQASVAWLGARFTRGTLPVLPNQFVFGPPTPLGTERLSDRELSRAPDWQAGVAAEYTYRLGGRGRIVGGVRYRYQDDVHFLETAQFGATFRAESWSELDLHVGFTSQSERWEVAVIGQNVFDDRHIAQVAAFGGLPVATLNQPEAWALQVRLSL